MSQGTVDAATIEQTKQQIRGLVQQIAQLSRSEVDAEEFYSEVLQKVVTALAAVGGAVWTITPDKRLKLDYQINLNRELLNTETEDAQRHLRLLQSVINSGEAKLAPPQSGGAEPNSPGNPTNTLLVLAPMLTDDSVEGVLEVFQRPDSQPASQQGYLRFLVQMSQLVGDWLKSRKLRHFSDRQSLWAEIDRFAKEAHNSLDLRETSYTIANEGRRLIGCDRLSVTVKKGVKHSVEAVSGQDTLDTRSNVVTLLRKLTDRVCAAGEPLWYNGEKLDLPPQIENALQDYIDESHTKSLAVIPIRKQDEPDDPDEMGKDDSVSEESKGDVIGALIVEQIDAPQSRDMLAPRVDLVRNHSTRALGNAMEHNNLFLMPVWRTLGKARLLVKARTLPKTLFFSTLTLTILISMVVVPWEFKLKARGTLEPVTRADVFVGVDGSLVDGLLASHGQQVEQGDLLLKLRNEALQQQYIDITGKITQGTARWENLRTMLIRANDQRDREGGRSATGRGGSSGKSELRAQLAQTKADLISYQEQLKSLDHQLELLQVASPIRGEVTTWDLERTLPKGRPLTKGDRVMEIADTSPDAEWELISFLPEADFGHLLRKHFEDDESFEGQDLKGKNITVSYILLNDPQNRLEGTLLEIQRAAELVEEEGVCYRLRIEVNEADLKEPRPGAEVISRVHCGKRALGFVLFHDAWEWVQKNLFF